jgi:hypothetical protein
MSFNLFSKENLVKKFTHWTWDLIIATSIPVPDWWGALEIKRKEEIWSRSHKQSQLSVWILSLMIQKLSSFHLAVHCIWRDYAPRRQNFQAQPKGSRKTCYNHIWTTGIYPTESKKCSKKKMLRLCQRDTVAIWKFVSDGIM